MSFVYCDGDSHELLGVLNSKKKDDVIAHFHRYTLKARLSVEEICIDMHDPYIQLIKDVFPNAKITIDRFHIVQLISRSLNNSRIKFMNEIKSKNNVLYKRLKNNWKLFLKGKYELSMERKYYNYSYKAYISQSEILEDLLKNSSDELKETYSLYQRLLSSIRDKDTVGFEALISKKYSNISAKMKTSLNTLKKNKEYVLNSLGSSLSNGPMEGINNIIKLQKRISFGFKNFKHFKIKIFYAFAKKIIKTA